MPWSSRKPGGRWRAGVLAILIAAGSMSAVSQAPPAPSPRYVVVLDAAHGGDDPGGLLNGKPEKDYTLALSVRLRSLLTARGIPVATTRESDVTMDAEHRAGIANHADAQACLSLHATLSGSGVHLFISSLAPAAPARFAPWKTAQAEWVTRSLALAGTLNSALLHAGIPVTLSRTAPLSPLKWPRKAAPIAPPALPRPAAWTTPIIRRA